MFNPGILKDNIKQISIHKQGNEYSWEIDSSIWAKADYTGNRNIFSNLGYAEKQVKFLIRKRDMTLHNAILWGDMHCFITDIVEADKGFYEVNTSIVIPRQCSIERTTTTQILNEYNRPVKNSSKEVIIFPSILSEKYVRLAYEQTKSTVESIYILTTPKVIEIKNGEVITIDNIKYETIVSHTLDEHKNEYEIRVRKES